MPKRYWDIEVSIPSIYEDLQECAMLEAARNPLNYSKKIKMPKNTNISIEKMNFEKLRFIKINISKFNQECLCMNSKSASPRCLL